MTALVKKEEIQIICPICKAKKQLKIPESIINQAKQLTTISIQKGFLCNHHFQAFIDKNFKVRGYQKIDFEIEPKELKDQHDRNKKNGNLKKEDNEIFEDLILEGNFVKYNPRSLNSKSINSNQKENKKSKMNKEMTLKQIYELFWDFIDDNNNEFKELIIKDKNRRRFLNKALTPMEY